MRSFARAVSTALVWGWGCAIVSAKSLTIALQPGIAYLPVIVADAQGFIRQEATAAGIADLTVEFKTVSGGPAANDALISGSADLVGMGIPPLLVVWDKTRTRDPVKIVAGLTILPYALLTNDPSKKTLADFKPDDRIAVNATTSVSAMLLRIKAAKEFGDANWQRLNALMVPLPHPESTNALLSRTIAGYMSVPPFTARLLQSGRITGIFTSKDVLGEDATGGLLAAREAFYRSNQPLVAAVTRAIDRGIDLIKSDPRTAAIDYLKTVSGSTTVDEMTAMISDPDMGYTSVPKGIMMYARYMKNWGLIGHLPTSPADVVFGDLGTSGAN